MPKKNDDLVPITEFITASQSNLEIAAAVFDHYLTEDLPPPPRTKTKAGKGSDAQDVTSFTLNVDKKGNIKIAKESWQGKYEIRIEAHNWGEKMMGGVWRHHGILRHTNYIPGLQEAFAGASLHPKRWMWYEAQFDLQSPASDWREPATLWRIHTDPRFLDEVEALFRSWMGIAVPLLDTTCERMF